MSRVRKPNKFMNTTKYNSNVTGPSKTVRIHSENEDYHKASTLSSWLFMKYDMSYKTYSNKSKNRKNELRAEYVADTGNESPQAKAKRQYQEAHMWDDDYNIEEENAYELLASIGVPFSPDGTPLGIEWD